MNRWEKHRGLTLAEVLIALVFATMAVLAVLSVQAFLLKADRKADVYNQAGVIASSLAAELENAGFDSVQTRPTGPVDPILDPERVGFTYSVDSSEVHPELKAVTIEVLWQDQQGGQRFELVTQYVKE